MTRQELINELKAGISQLEKMGNLTKEVEVAHQVCTGMYGGDLNEIDQLELSFIEEEYGNVVIMQYSVCEI